MCLDRTEPIPAALNPTFLFTWKCRRTRTEENYHSHDFAEIAFILSGQGRYRIDDVVYPVRDGNILLLNPGRKHQSIVSDASTPMTEFFVALNDFSLPGLPDGFLTEPAASPILPSQGELNYRLYSIVSSMDAENAGALPGHYIMMKSYLLQMMTLILRSTCAAGSGPAGCSFESTGKKYLVEQVLHYFEDHYNEKISLDRIADNMYLSPFYISKVFKSETGDPPIRHLIDIRLEKAMDILNSQKELNIREVATMVGYDDAYHFSRLFKKKFGVAPSQIRGRQG